MEHATGGVIRDGNQTTSLLGHEGEPGMHAPVQMQQFPKTGARLPPSAMPPARPALFDQPRGLQRLFHIAVRQADAVLPAGDLMEMPHIEAAVPLAIELHDLLNGGQGHTVDRRLATAPVE